MSRVSWDEYFFQLARAAATRSTCDRKHVGCVLVRDRSVLASGYNGSVTGEAHCTDAGHLMEAGHCVRTVHAEANAIALAAKHGTRVESATAYVTATPCSSCYKLLLNAGVVRIVAGERYGEAPGDVEYLK